MILTREKAHQILQDTYKYMSNGDAVDVSEAFNMAMEAQKAQEALQAPTDGDSISRQGVINLIRREVFWCDNLIDEIKLLPSTNRPTGEWIDKGEYAECSICGGHSGTQFDGVEPIPLKTNFCPNCGAIMKGEDDETD